MSEKSTRNQLLVAFLHKQTTNSSTLRPLSAIKSRATWSANITHYRFLFSKRKLRRHISTYGTNIKVIYFTLRAIISPARNAETHQRPDAT